MKEITEIDMEKYFVLKREDIDRYLISGWQTELARISLLISECRKADGKKENNYLVLNLDDEIDGEYLFRKLNQIIPLNANVKVSDIAVALVNAILKTKAKP